MKKFNFSSIVLFVAVLLFHPACNKENVAPDTGLPPKQMDYITDNAGKVLYRFFYENDTIVEFKYFGNYYAYERVEFKYGKLFRYHFPGGHYIQYTFPYHPNDSVMYIAADQDSTDLMAIYYFEGNKVVAATVYPYNSVRVKYKYFYNEADNLIRIESFPEGSTTITHYKFTHDEAPNPWYGMGIVDDFMSLSKNNYIEINDYPYNRYKYNDEGYMIESHNIYTGILKYYYRED